MVKLLNCFLMRVFLDGEKEFVMKGGEGGKIAFVEEVKNGREVC